ncbi:MAG: phosphate regulon sensor histidine kinase PhoR [Gammaproteobacteria bacterium]|nr:phosphate regulon sensor histidine kinase PhoR [Gammaproteobacteria bacterium]MBQ0839299.1 phosphate regulon sensor histidine kinase PhoR [Gammaproteobacteria bacterium]
MQQGLRVELQRIILLALALAIAGFFNGYQTLTMLLGGGLYMAWTLLKIFRLYSWLNAGGLGAPPDATGVWGDISDQLYRLQKRNTRARSDLRALVKRVRKITAALDEGLIILDEERTVDWWNPAASRLLGLRSEDLHQPITNLLRAPTFVQFIQCGDFEYPLELSAPNEPQRLLQFSARVFGDNEIALVIMDITRLRQLEEMRKEFVGNISHELRTPLTVLTGYIETLLDQDMQELPAAWPKALRQMSQQTERMNLLAEDLVMLSRLETTTLPLKVPVNLEQLFEPIIDNARALSGDKHNIQFSACHQPLLEGDAKELHSALSNLVYNAVKHNPQGCDIDIAIKRDANALSVSVSDTGLGIDPIHIPRLTERFYRADSSRATQSGGTGLGLAIVKHVLLRHNGELTIKSTLGKGATFTCRFAQS